MNKTYPFLRFSLFCTLILSRSSTPPKQSAPLTLTNKSYRKQRGYNPTYAPSTVDRGKTSSTGTTPPTNVSRTISLTPTNNPPKRQLRLTDAEFQARKDKGLCFHCDERFARGHKCRKQLDILLVHDDEIGEADHSDQDWAPVDIDSTEVNGIHAASVSCNSVHGLSK